MADELLDVFDDQGRPTGEQKMKSFVHHNGIRHKTVHVWIMNQNGELLVQLRSPKKESHPSKWDISAAGHIGAGETSLQGAMRETEEELGLKMLGKEFKYLFTIDAPRFVINDGGFIDHEFQDVYLVQLKGETPELKLQNEEVAETKWIPWRKLKELAEKRDDTFVLHSQEYARLYSVLESTMGMLPEGSSG